MITTIYRYLPLTFLLLSTTPSLYSAEKKTIYIYDESEKIKLQAKDTNQLLSAIRINGLVGDNSAIFKKDTVEIKQDGSVATLKGSIYHKYTVVKSKTVLQNNMNFYLANKIQVKLTGISKNETKTISKEIYCKTHTPKELDLQLAYGSAEYNKDNRLLLLLQDEHVYIIDKTIKGKECFIKKEDFHKVFKNGANLNIKQGYRNIIIETTDGKRVDYLVQLSDLPKKKTTPKGIRKKAQALFKKIILEINKLKINTNIYRLAYSYNDKFYQLNEKNIFSILARSNYEVKLELLAPEEAGHLGLGLYNTVGNLGKFKIVADFPSKNNFIIQPVFIDVNLLEEFKPKEWKNYMFELREALKKNNSFLKNDVDRDNKIDKMYFFPFENQKKRGAFAPVVADSTMYIGKEIIGKYPKGNPHIFLSGKIGYAAFVCEFSVNNKTNYATYVWDEKEIEYADEEDIKKIKFGLARQIKLQGGNPREIAIDDKFFFKKTDSLFNPYQEFTEYIKTRNGYYTITTQQAANQKNSLAPTYKITFNYNNKNKVINITPACDIFSTIINKVNDKKVTQGGLFTINGKKYSANSYFPYLDYTKKVTVKYSYSNTQLVLYSDEAMSNTEPEIIEEYTKKTYDVIIQQLKKSQTHIVFYTKENPFDEPQVLINIGALTKAKNEGSTIYYTRGITLKYYENNDNVLFIQLNDNDQNIFKTMYQSIQNKKATAYYFFYKDSKNKYKCISKVDDFNKAIKDTSIPQLRVEYMTQEDFNKLSDSNSLKRALTPYPPALKDYQITLHKKEGSTETIPVKISDYLPNEKNIFSYVKDKGAPNAEFYRKNKQGKVVESLGNGYENFPYNFRLNNEETLHYGKLYQCKVNYNSAEETILTESGDQTVKEALGDQIGNNDLNTLPNIFRKIKLGGVTYYQPVDLTLQELEEEGCLDGNGTSLFHATHGLEVTYKDTTSTTPTVVKNLAAVQTLKDIYAQFDPTEENYITEIKINGSKIDYNSTILEKSISELAYGTGSSITFGSTAVLHLEITTAKKKSLQDPSTDTDDDRDETTEKPNNNIGIIVTLTFLTIALGGVAFYYKDKLKAKLQAFKKKQAKRKKQTEQTPKKKKRLTAKGRITQRG